MYGKLFGVPSLSQTVAESFIAPLTDIISYEYTERFARAGEFTIVLAMDKTLLPKLRINRLIVIGNASLIIEGISYDGKNITVTGKDCCGLLSRRKTIWGASQGAGTDGYDVVSGTTVQCIKHYLDNNIINPVDSERAMPVRWSNPSGITGLSSDSYMSRLEDLENVVRVLCEDAGIGYKIYASLAQSAAPGLVFSPQQGIDRSVTQNVRPRVIFSAGWRNVTGVRMEHDISNLYNTVYVTGNNDLTLEAYRGNSAPEGIGRIETAVSVSADDAADIRRFGLCQIEDNTETHSYQIVPVSDDYGDKYSLGDIVSVKDEYTGNFFNARITEAKLSYSAGSRTVQLTLGTGKQKLLQKIVNNMIGGTLRRR